MARKDMMTPQAIDVADRLYESVEVRDKLATALRDYSVKPAVGYGELYRYATESGYQGGDAFHKALREDEALRADLAYLLDKVCVVHFPRAAAAASAGVLAGREADNCNIRFHTSQADDSQIYVVIEFAEGMDSVPSALIVRKGSELVDKMTLPEMEDDGTIQLLLDRESVLLKGLMDAESEVYVR